MRSYKKENDNTSIRYLISFERASFWSQTRYPALFPSMKALLDLLYCNYEQTLCQILLDLLVDLKFCSFHEGFVLEEQKVARGEIWGVWDCRAWRILSWSKIAAQTMVTDGSFVMSCDEHSLHTFVLCYFCKNLKWARAYISSVTISRVPEFFG